MTGADRARAAAIVLAGGRSARMGRSKAMLAWHGSTLLRRAAGLAARAVDGPIVVVHAAGQQLPPLPATVELAQDAREARGPLQGIAAGLAAIGDRAELVAVTAVDAPLLHPALVRLVVAQLRAAGDELDACLPHAHGFDQPLAAAYRVRTVAALIAALLAADRLATRPLFERCRVCRLDERALLRDAALAAHDPQLHSLLSLNEPAAYAAALARPLPLVTVERPGARRATVHAAMLAHAGSGRAIIDERETADPQTPLVAGDIVRFVSR